MRMFLVCEHCGGKLLLYRIDDNTGSATPRGRERDLEPFLQEHAQHGPFLSVVTEGGVDV
jgi:hypothetical protein